MTDFEQLNRELKKAGVPEHEFLGEKGNSIDTLVNTKISSKPYIDILLNYLPKLLGFEQEMVVRALTEKGNKKATPFLLEIFKEPEKNKNILWAVSNALYVINDSATYPAIINLCNDKSLGAARQMLMGILAKIKTEETFQILLDSLADSSIKAHAIEALGKFGDPRAIDILEKTDVVKGKYEYRAKQTAIKRLNKKK